MSDTPTPSVIVAESDVDLGDGHVLHVYDTGNPGTPGVEPLVVVWHHGTPNIGAPPRPLFDAAARLGIRWVSYDRPGYGGSTARPGRDVGSAARDVAAVADSLGVGSFAVMGHSGGGTHALAPASLPGDRVRGVVSISPVAPFGTVGLDWFGGMAPGGEASLRAAAAGREAKEAHEAAAGQAAAGQAAAGQAPRARPPRARPPRARHPEPGTLSQAATSQAATSQASASQAGARDAARAAVTIISELDSRLECDRDRARETRGVPL